MTELNLTSAFFVTQLVLLLIVFAGVLVLRAGESLLSPYAHEAPRVATYYLPSFLLAFALVTIACLVFSQDFVLLSKPVFGDVELPAFSRSASFLIVFTLNIFGAGILMKATGGAMTSPFSVVLFTLPALAIFLREPPSRYFSYTGFAIVFFLAYQRRERFEASVLQNPLHRLAFNVVTLGVLALATLVGYVTRPT